MGWSDDGPSSTNHYLRVTSMTSQFDPIQFLDAQTTEAATRRPPLPAGVDFLVTISDMKMTPWTKRDDPSKSGFRLDLTLELDLSAYPDIKTAIGWQGDKIKLNDGVMLDTTTSGLDFSPGKNNRLRQYREALGQNVAGQAWSPRMMQGQLVKIKIKHEPYNDEIQERIGGVAKAT